MSITQIVVNVHEYLYERYKATNQYKLALKHYQTSELLVDSLFNENSLAELHELNAKYESEKKTGRK